MNDLGMYACSILSLMILIWSDMIIIPELDFFDMNINTI